MLAGAEVETPAWQGEPCDGIPGCSVGAGGRGFGVGLTGGKPGVVGCCAAASMTEMFGSGASGRSGGRLRCAWAAVQANAAPARAETNQVHLDSNLRRIFEMYVLLCTRTEGRHDMSHPEYASLFAAPKGQTERVGPEFKKQLAAHVARNGGAEATRGNSGRSTIVRVVCHGEKASQGMAEQSRETGPLLAIVVEA